MRSKTFKVELLNLSPITNRIIAIGAEMIHSWDKKKQQSKKPWKDLEITPIINMRIIHLAMNLWWKCPRNRLHRPLPYLSLLSAHVAILSVNMEENLKEMNVGAQTKKYQWTTFRFMNLITNALESKLRSLWLLEDEINW